jgi:hypothetical protein
MYRAHAVVVAIVVLWNSAAFAQGSYVSAAVLADVVRTTHTEYRGAPEPTGGEAIGFALRAGTPLGGFWGVEVEFARPGEIEREIGSGIRPLVEPSLTGIPPSVLGGLPVDYQAITRLVPPSFTYTVRSTERNTTLSAALWLQQQLTGRFAMVYLGGVAFSRSEFESDLTFVPLFPTPPIAGLIALPPTRTDTIIYGVQPMVGIESRIEMSEHARLVPGLRMHASDGRWFIRPSIGIGWTF